MFGIVNVIAIADFLLHFLLLSFQIDFLFIKVFDLFVIFRLLGLGLAILARFKARCMARANFKAIFIFSYLLL
jgi:hypothetical protein